MISSMIDMLVPLTSYELDRKGDDHHFGVIDGLEIESRKQKPPSTTSDVPVM